MAEHRDSPSGETAEAEAGGTAPPPVTDGQPEGGPPIAGPPRRSPSQEASELWKLLASEPGDRPGAQSAPAAGDSPGSPKSPSQASDAEPGAASEAGFGPATGIETQWNEPAAWVVDPIPSAAEGGVLAMFTNRSKALAPNVTRPAGSGVEPGHPPTPVPDAGGFIPVAPPWATAQGDDPLHNDRDRLVDMLDNLPGPLPRVGR